jgi:RND superfamily putative drug exporter
MSSLLHRLGRFSAGHPWRVIIAWSVVAIAVVAGSGAFGRELEDSFTVPGIDSQQATDLLSEAGSDRAGLTARVVATPLDPEVTFDASTATADALDDVSAELRELTNALAIGDPVISPDGRTAMVSVRYPVQESLTAADLDELVETVERTAVDSPLQIEVGGDLFFAFDEPDSGLGEMAGLLVAVIVLIVAFGSVIAMGLPIGMALFGLAIGISTMSLVAHLIEVPSWAPQIGSMIGLGVGIDYALFLVTRHREFLANGVDVVEAAGRAVATAGQAVIFAGGTVVIAILGLAVAGVPFMTAAGVAISLIVLIMVVASVTLLPAFLGIAGPWVNRLGIHRRGTTGQIGNGWARWGRHVMRHAWGYTIGVTALLLAMTAPVLALELGFPDDGTQPETETRRRAYDLMSDGFGPGVNGPLVIAIDTSADPSVVEPLARAIAADPGIASVERPVVDTDSGVTAIVALPTTAPQDAATFATVERLRADVFPNVLDDSPAVAHVGGTTANFGDVANRVSDRLAAFIGAVILLSFFLLMLVFRSVLVALKAALLNLLSIGASYGVLVMVFQWGWAKDLIGLEGAVPIVSFIPMFMFAILFGLSMDYEVFLLSRVRERYVVTRDNDASVIHGLASTARVITSAALIMISVFGGFVFGDDPTTKMFGLGLAVAIFVDATIVRVVLVPAMMHLMGDANWWLPAWLDRRLPQMDIDGGRYLVDVEHHAVADTDTDPQDDSDERDLVGVGS